MPDHKKENIIQLFGVSKRYGAKYALKDLSLSIGRGEFVFITGPSGAGKTTLLKLLYLGEPPSDGHIIINGVNISRVEKKQIPKLRRTFGIIFQDYKLISTRTIFENVALVLEVFGEKGSTIEKKVRRILRNVGLEGKMNALPASLSGGEQQRVAFARAVVGSPEIILADEPTGNLDAESADVIFNLLKDRNQKGATLLVATHDLGMIKRNRARVIALKEGRMVS